MTSTQKKLTRLSASVSLVFGTLLAVSNSAYAASFTTTVQQDNGAKGDTFLKSITQNGKTTDKFNLVNKVDILSNTAVDKTKGSNADASLNKGVTNNTGAASTDKGDNASSPTAVSGVSDPTGGDIAAYMGNTNLNNIVDTEEAGSFVMNMFFQNQVKEDNSGLDSFYIFERGFQEMIYKDGKVMKDEQGNVVREQAGNSSISVRAIDAAGNVIGKALKLTKQTQTDAGYSIDTTEIGGAQRVGSWGISLADLGVSDLLVAGLQLSANGYEHNGPDFKLVGRMHDRPEFESATTPEPGSLLALGAVGGLAFFKRRQKQN
ncbi:MAG: PEP-CTERM sorting domain-containing protein [Scytonematopsis contorta HA4267-MV1]|nr:PEP-CTERM sorting domain-containing protein [Scytonematopsis contorta HA4267-MV1]